jgi:hypothetical protein
MHRSVREVSPSPVDRPPVLLPSAKKAVIRMVAGFRSWIVFCAITNDKALYRNVADCYSSCQRSMEIGSLACLALP